MCLQRLQPDITISLLRREINFLCDINDGSAKVGEIHFGRYKYREANFSYLPNIINKLITHWWMAQLENKVKKLDRFVVLTHEDATHWRCIENLQVIPNPITIQPHTVSDYSQKRAIAVGRYTHQKGFDLLIEAWNEVNKIHPDWTLYIYGGGNSKYYQDQADTLGLHNAVKCCGPVENIQEKYLNSSIFILSSRFEGLPLALMEAMSSGLPPVAFKCPCGPKDLIHSGKDGILCPNEDLEKLIKAICCLIENEPLRKNMGKNAIENMKQFSMENVMTQWDKLFRSLSNQK